MTFPNIDHMLVGVVVAFDADTGEVLDVHEKFVETVDGKPGCATDITRIECEEIRADAARSFPHRRVDVIAGSSEMGQREEEAPVRYRVDPMTRKLRVEPEGDLILEAIRALEVTPNVRKASKKKKKKKSR
jgi:hypothetical protein